MSLASSSSGNVADFLLQKPQVLRQLAGRAIRHPTDMNTMEVADLAKAVIALLDTKEAPDRKQDARS